MSAIRPASREGPGGSGSSAITAPGAWAVRPAREDDVAGVAAAVRELLLELDGAPGAPSATQDAARALIRDPAAGAVLVAEADGELVGMLGVSWQTAIHVPGAYALIQEVWVRPDWRGRAVGRDLLEQLAALARACGLARLEVGLPREQFAHFAATEAFYLGNGFTANGPRMRRLLA